MKYSNPQEAWYHGLKKEPQGDGCMLSVVSIAFLILTIAMMLAFSGCTTTKYVPVIEHATDTLVQRVIERDSIHVHDSIRVSEKGDTIRIERWRTRYIERASHDTIYQSKHDTIPQPYQVEKLVPRERSKVEWGLIIVGIVALMGVIVWIALKLKRFLP